MKVDEEVNRGLGLNHLLDQSFKFVDDRVGALQRLNNYYCLEYLMWSIPKTIEVLAGQVTPKVASLHTINVDHGEDVEFHLALQPRRFD